VIGSPSSILSSIISPGKNLIEDLFSAFSSKPSFRRRVKRLPSEEETSALIVLPPPEESSRKTSGTLDRTFILNSSPVFCA